MRRVALSICLLALLLVPGAAGAKTKAVFWQIDAGSAERVFDNVGFVPIAGIQPKGSPPQTVKSGSTTYKVAWQNTTFNRRTTSVLLKEIHRYERHDLGAYTDRPLKGKEKSRFDVLADLGRDADVLVVSPQNPVCQSGLTFGQAKKIARGRIKRWSEVGAPSLGAIKRRVAGEQGFAEPRFGAQSKLGRTIVKPDGGVSELGDANVAALTAWSRVRSNSSVCAVPINGVAPTNVSVYRREYRPAYPMQFVMHAKRRRDREGRAMVRAYVDFLKSEKATALFRGTGMLMVADGEPSSTTPGGTSGGGSGSVFGAPSQDYAGRPVTAQRDDDAAAQAMAGRRLQSATRRLVFEPGGVFRDLALNDDGTCAGTTEAQWAILEAWTYAEYGGGLIARVRAIHPDHEALYTVELPGDQPGTAYVNGQPHADDPSLAGSCV